MSKRPGNKKGVSAWVTPEMDAAIEQWRKKQPRIVSRTEFATQACLEKLRREGFEIDDSDVFRDGRVRDPSSPEDSVEASAMKEGLEIVKPPPEAVRPTPRKRKPKRHGGHETKA